MTPRRLGIQCTTGPVCTDRNVARLDQVGVRSFRSSERVRMFTARIWWREPRHPAIAARTTWGSP